MYYYEFTWIYPSGKKGYCSCEPQERGDQVDYLNESVRNGTIESWDMETKSEY